MSTRPNLELDPSDEDWRERMDEPSTAHVRLVPLEAHEISLADLARKFLRLMWLHPLIAALCFGAAYYFIDTLPVKYRSEGTLLFRQQISASGQLSGALSSLNTVSRLIGGPQADSRLLQILARIKSRSFLKPLIREQNLLPLIFADQWSEATGRWATPDGKAPSEDAAYGRLAGEIKTKVDPDTQIIEYWVGSRQPEASMKLADIVLREFNAAYRREQRDETSRKIQLIESKLTSTETVELRNVLLAIYATELSEQILETVQLDYPLKLLDPPQLPTGPYSPNKRLIYMVAVAATVTLSLFVTMVWPSRRRPRRRT